MQSNRLQGLDALRGIASLCVLTFHAAGTNSSNAYLAVDFFFMLSGYVMARTYEERLHAGMGTVGLLKARLVRLWPTMLLASLIGLPWLASWTPTNWLVLISIANLLLIPTPMLNRVFLLNGPAWSIFFELFANVVHGLILQRLNTRWLQLLLLLLIAVLAYFASRFTMEMGATPASFIGGVPRVLLSYSIGILLWRRWRDIPAFKVSTAFTFAAMPIAFLASAFVDGQSWQADLLFVLVVCPMLIAGGLKVATVPAPLRYLGILSFPLYAVHGPVLETSKMLGVSMWWGALLSFPIAAIVLALTSRLSFTRDRSRRHNPSESSRAPIMLDFGPSRLGSKRISARARLGLRWFE